MALHAAAALLFVLATAGHAAARPASLLADITTGKSLAEAPGYTMRSDVSSYLTVSKDVCEYKAALKAATPDFATAKALYTAGKNSVKSDGTVRTFKALATGNNAGEPFWDAYTAYFKTPAFVDQIATQALNGAAPFTDPLARREIAMKAVEANLLMAYIMHELDEAAYKIKELKETGDKDGAPHNVDEVYALYVGGSNECSPMALAAKRGAAFGTCNKVNAAMIKALSAAQAAARAGNLGAFMEARSKIQSLFATVAVQATIEYAEQTEAARKAGEPTAELQAEGYALFRTIEPLVAQASPTAAATVRKLLYPGNPVVPNINTQVAAALRTAYAGLGITAAEVGTYSATPRAC